ncbi:hypothetical protein ACFOGI_10415 [Virgibacillus xinjiangensis]|uniref:Uncharacterized protein n=1 Tax=Virgibacillus xinjiangensis TaxID=393090 RepID=A0ABV7CWX4_9BACI
MRYLTDEELQLAGRFLFLSMAILVIRQDTAHIQQGPFKIKGPYLDLLQNMETAALKERHRLRKEMREKGLRIVRLNKNDSFSTFLFICRGHEEKRNYFNPAIRMKVEAIVQELMAAALQPDQPHASANT